MNIDTQKLVDVGRTLASLIYHEAYSLQEWQLDDSHESVILSSEAMQRALSEMLANIDRFALIVCDIRTGWTRLSVSTPLQLSATPTCLENKELFSRQTKVFSIADHLHPTNYSAVAWDLVNESKVITQSIQAIINNSQAENVWFEEFESILSSLLTQIQTKMELLEKVLLFIHGQREQ